MKRWQEIVLFSVVVPFIIGTTMGVCSAKKRAEVAPPEASVYDEIGWVTVQEDVVVREPRLGERPGSACKKAAVCEANPLVLSRGDREPVYEVFDWHDLDPTLEKRKHVWYRINDCWWVWGGACTFRANEKYLARLRAEAKRLAEAQEDYEGEGK